MLKSKDVPAEEQSELFRLADEMQQKDADHAREHRSATEAAAELGVAPEYLEKAAAELHARRLEKIERNRKRNRGLAIGFVVFAIAGMWFSMRPAPRRIASAPAATISKPLTLAFEGASVRHSSDVADAATASARGGKLEIDIRSMSAGKNRRHFANVAIPISIPGNYRKALVTFSGSGVSNLRVDLEDGNVRWKSPNIRVESGTRTEAIDLTRATKQERRNDNWRNVAWSPPGSARELVLKFGDTINPAGTRGTVVVEKIVLE